jgi:hypothetical protein
MNKSKQSADMRRELGNTGFKIFPVVYGGIISMDDGQEASDNYVSWAIDSALKDYPFFDKNGQMAMMMQQ